MERYRSLWDANFRRLDAVLSRLASTRKTTRRETDAGRLR